MKYRTKGKDLSFTYLPIKYQRGLVLKRGRLVLLILRVFKISSRRGAAYRPHGFQQYNIDARSYTCLDRVLVFLLTLAHVCVMDL